MKFSDFHLTKLYGKFTCNQITSESAFWVNFQVTPRLSLSSRHLQLFSGDAERVLGALKEMENLHSVL